MTLQARATPAGRTATAVSGRYLGALDGLRALAVSGVIAYHLGLPWAQGGYLGVDLFFVLSGFLITSLLLEEWMGTGRLRLAAFWARRIRRLMPALFLLLVVIAVFVVLEGRFGAPASIAQIDLGGLRGDALATLFYVANWHSIFAHQSYFAQFAAPSPFEHTWSLAIEEQFYLAWPPTLLLLLSRSGRRFRGAGVVLCVVAVAASSLEMALLYHSPSDATRVYFGTDTRTFDLLCGAVLAMVTAGRPQPAGAARRWLNLASFPALAALGAFWALGGSPSGLPTRFMFEGGFLVCALLAAVVIADVRQLQPGPLARLLGLGPLRYLGRISYGIYLWHWPVIVYMTPGRTGLGQPWLDLARLATILAAATASFYMVEQPIRRRRIAGWPRWALAPATAATVAVVVTVATVPAIAAPGPRAPTSAPVPVKTVPTTSRPRSPAHVYVEVPSGVPGAGGIAAEQPIEPPKGTVISPQHPLRLMFLGDSMMVGAELGLDAALGATGEVTYSNNAIDGFGLSVVTQWRTALPALVRAANPDLVVATWSWDESCTAAPALHHGPCALQEPKAYQRELEEAVRLMLHTGHVWGVVFLQFPLLGPVIALSKAAGTAETASRLAGEAAWARIASSLPSVFPGKVMYLPVGPSVLWHGRFSSWLPPATDPTAPLADWVRVRMVDNVHLCPAGVVRYSDAVLADLTAIYHLSAARGAWWEGSWTGDPRYNSPPGACPDDHPPGG